METIVQIGVAHAIDHVYDIIKNKNFENVFAILIEPNIHSIPLIKKQYELLKTKVISNIAISYYDGTIPVYFNNYESGDSQHASVKESHLHIHGDTSQNITKVDVLCFSLNTYLNKIFHFDDKTVIDSLYIDTEGHDCDILLNTDFSKLNISKIYFEVTHSENTFSGSNTEKYKNTRLHLEHYGYIETQINNDSATFIKNQ